MKKLYGLFAVAVVVAACAVLPVAYGTGKAASSRDLGVPKIAQILGIRVGRDTNDLVEKRLGPGAPCMGGHPSGGQAWLVKPKGIWVYDDAFVYDAHGGAIVDMVRLACSKKDADYDFDYQFPKPKVPIVRASASKIGWLGRIVPGMSRDEVLKATRGLPKPKATDGNLVWTQKGTFKSVEGAKTAVWTATLTFEKGKLTVIDVDVANR